MKAVLAADQREAMRILAERRAADESFDLILLDSVLSGATGLALARGIVANELGGRAKVVLLEVMGRHEEMEFLESANIRAWLFKPVRPLRLLECFLGLTTGKLNQWHPGLAADLALPEGVGRNFRVLLAEDNPVNQKVVLHLLRHIGLQADAVANGLEVLQALTQIPYDVVLLDCHMPEMDGYTAAEEIRQRWRDACGKPPLKSKPYIIALTANVVQGERERCLAAGMDDYLTKPLETGQLLAALGRAGLTLRAAGAGTSEGAAQDEGEILSQEVLSKLRSLRQPGEPDPAVELIDLYLQDMPRHLQQMQDAVNRQDANLLRQAAHSLKGSSRNMGVLRLAQSCAELEKQARDGQLANAQALLAKIQADFADAQKALEGEKLK
jgi:CheY-like chemotaxis protein